MELKKQAQGWKKTKNCWLNTVTSGSRKKMVTSIMLNSLLTVVYSAAGDIMVVCQYFVSSMVCQISRLNRRTCHIMSKDATTE